MRHMRMAMVGSATAADASCPSSLTTQPHLWPTNNSPNMCEHALVHQAYAMVSNVRPMPVAGH
eukprot:12653702-Alexandrium_andersonii.AAC.1